jgi:hypothetical protein
MYSSWLQCISLFLLLASITRVHLCFHWVVELLVAHKVVIVSPQRPLLDNTQQNSIHAPVGFEPTISAGEHPQTYTIDRAATGTYTSYSMRFPNHH